MKKIILNMIVRDEEHVIGRSIASALPHVDAVAILDTGSMDNTTEAIHAAMEDSGKPFAIGYEGWTDFSTARNNALGLAGHLRDKEGWDADTFALILDADETIRMPDRSELSLHEQAMPDAYYVDVELDGTTYASPRFLKLGRWAWEGVVHEIPMPLVAPDSDLGYWTDSLRGVKVIPGREGSRSQDPDKYLKDAEKLESVIKQNPDDSRTAFYLAQSYRDGGRPDEALLWYRYRARMGGWPEEVYIAWLNAARISGLAEDYLRASEVVPHRIEARVDLAFTLRTKDLFHAAALMARPAVTIAEQGTPEGLFIENACYDYRAKDELAVALYWTGGYDEALQLNESLLESGKLPESEIPRIEENIRQCQAQLTQTVA